MSGKRKKANPVRSPNARRHREFVRFTTEDGEALILLWLDRFGYAVMEERAHDWLKERLDRKSLEYFAVPDGKGHAYVALWMSAEDLGKKKGSNAAVHRLLLDAPPRRPVRFDDENPFNLRLSNILPPKGHTPPLIS